MHLRKVRCPEDVPLDVHRVRDAHRAITFPDYIVLEASRHRFFTTYGLLSTFSPPSIEEVGIELHLLPV